MVFSTRARRIRISRSPRRGCPSSPPPAARIAGACRTSANVLADHQGRQAERDEPALGAVAPAGRAGWPCGGQEGAAGAATGTLEFAGSMRGPFVHLSLKVTQGGRRWAGVGVPTSRAWGTATRRGLAGWQQAPGAVDLAAEHGHGARSERNRRPARQHRPCPRGVRGRSASAASGSPVGAGGSGAASNTGMLPGRLSASPSSECRSAAVFTGRPSTPTPAGAPVGGPRRASAPPRPVRAPRGPAGSRSR